MSDVLINAASIQNVRVSEKTVWRHLVVQAGAFLGLGEFTVDAPHAALQREAEALARSITGRHANLGLVDEHADLRQRDLAGAALVSALDQSIQDIRAQAANLPLAAWLGQNGNDPVVPLYANVNRRTIDRSPAGFGASAERAVKSGFTAIKIAPFDTLEPGLCGSRQGSALIDGALERIAAVRAVLPPSAELLIDCHWRLNAAAAVELLPKLAALDVAWLECPLPETGAACDAIARLRSKANDLGIRLAGCETMTMWDGFRPFVMADAYDVIMPDVKYVGGFAALREIVEQASRRKVAVSLHNPSGPVCHLHSLHACAALGLSERLELQFDESPIFDTLVTPSPPPREGGISRLPEGIGLGARLAGGE